MFKNEGDQTYINMLICNREIFVANGLCGVVWVAVAVRNFIGVKLAFVYLLAAMFVGNSLFMIACYLLENWVILGPE
jgi:hypothetical protein